MKRIGEAEIAVAKAWFVAPSAPTGVPPRMWTTEAKVAVVAAMRNVLAAEQATGDLIETTGGI